MASKGLVLEIAFTLRKVDFYFLLIFIIFMLELRKDLLKLSTRWLGEKKEQLSGNGKKPHPVDRQ